MDVRLRVTDNQTATDARRSTLTVIANQTPTASFTATPNPAVPGQTSTFDASASNDPDGTIAKYEWDLDGNGTYETDTGTTTTTSQRYADHGDDERRPARHRQRRRDRDQHASGHRQHAAASRNYGDTVLDTPGLVDYWRLGEASGTDAGRQRRLQPGHRPGRRHARRARRFTGDPNTAARFDGVNDCASVPRRPVRHEQA